MTVGLAIDHKVCDSPPGLGHVQPLHCHIDRLTCCLTEIGAPAAVAVDPAAVFFLDPDLGQNIGGCMAPDAEICYQVTGTLIFGVYVGFQ